MKRGVIVTIAGLLLVACQGPTQPITDTASSPPQFSRTTNVITITDLGTLGGPNSQGRSINNVGQVVGSSGQLPSGRTHAFLWTEQSGMIDLGVLPGGGAGEDSQAFDINDRGQVVGRSTTAFGTCGFLWTQQDGMICIGTLGGLESLALAINNRGQVVGNSTTAAGPAGQNHAILWTERDGMIDLGTLPGTDNSQAFDINDHGQVVGVSRQSPRPIRAFLWTQRDGMIDLGTLGGGFTFATGINNRGQVVGFGETTTGAVQVFLWENGTMTDLGTPSGAAHSEAGLGGINDRGQVVGESRRSGFDLHAFLWTKKDGMIDLGTLGGGFSLGSGINNRGQVAGESQVAVTGNTHATLWTLRRAKAQ